jgi:RNA polymerase sigma factor (sigma-70 family)
MAQEPLRAVLDYLKKVSAAQEMHTLPDAALLDRFVERREEAAFSALVHRHGPMVLAVCRRVLGNVHDADDAFQGTFMVLVRRARSVHKDRPLGNWLYGVAQRVALKARARSAARQGREREFTDMPRAEPLDERTWQDLRPLLDEEIGRLPEKYRAAIVLCYLQGKSHEQAAADLGWPRTSLTNRLTRARDLLRRQLASRGVTLSAGLLASALAEKSTPQAVGAMLAIKTAKAAASLAAGKTVAQTILSAQALALAEEAMKGMFAINLKVAVAAVALGLVIGGAGVAGYHTLGGGSNVDSATPAATQSEPPKKVDVAKQAKQQTPTVDANGDPLPTGAIARLGADRWRHDKASVTAFLPDGKTVITAGHGDRTIRYWEYPSGKEIVSRRITPPAENVGKGALGSGGSGFVAVAASVDGKTIAVSDGQPVVYLYEAVTGKELHKLAWTQDEAVPDNGFGLRARNLAFSPNGGHLAVLEGNGIIRVWDWAKAKEIHRFKADSADPRVLTYSPDGQAIATISLAKGADKALTFWNPVTGAKVGQIRNENFIGRESSFAFSPDGKTLAVPGFVGPNGGVAIYAARPLLLLDAATGKETGRLPDAGFPVVFGKDGSKLYTANQLKLAELIEWDVAIQKPLRRLPTSLRPIDLMTLSPDGKTLICYVNGPSFFDISGKDIELSGGPAKELTALRFLPDGKHLLVAAGRAVQKWDVAASKNLGTMGLTTDAVQGLRNFSSDVKLSAQFNLASKETPPKVAITDVQTVSELRQITLQDIKKYPQYGTLVPPIVPRFSPDGTVLALRQVPLQAAQGPDQKNNDGRIELYSVPEGALLRTLRVETPVQNQKPKTPALSNAVLKGALNFSPDGTILVSSIDANTFLFWDIKSGQRIGSLTLPPYLSKQAGPYTQYPSCVEPALFTPDGRCLAVEMSDGTTGLYELATGEFRRVFGQDQLPKKGIFLPLGTPLHYPCFCFDFSPDGKMLAQADLVGAVHVWDVMTGRELGIFKGHALPVQAIAFAPDGKTVASASEDTTVLIWDVSNLSGVAPPTKSLQPANLERRWKSLAEPDAKKGFESIAELVAAPRDTLAFLKPRLKPAASIDMKRVEELLSQLNSEQFQTRKKAEDELSKLDSQIVPAIEKSLTANLPLEPKLRLEELRNKLTRMTLEGDRLQAYRAIEVLELIGTSEARQLLQMLVDGAPGALVTVNAKAALKRLNGSR